MNLEDPCEAAVAQALRDWPDLEPLFCHASPTDGALWIHSQSALRRLGGLLVRGGAQPMRVDGILCVKVEDDGTIDVFHWPPPTEPPRDYHPPVHRRYITSPSARRRPADN